jgi:DNA invertase Pin-like site-specific DNA recombinase
MRRRLDAALVPAAIYARYSTDKQDARSTEDQIRRCRRYAETQGYRIAAVYEDKAVSGAHAARVDLQRMLRDARVQGGSPFSAVLVDDQSRLARDLGTAWRLIFEELPPLGIKVVDCTTGRASDETGARLTFGVTALMNDAFLEMVRAETHRGMEGRALAGFATGGRCYGYRTRKEENPPDPEHPRSEIVIDDDEAKLVVRIFRMWIDGQSFKSIAVTLNDERIPAPHDGGKGHKGNRGWVPGTIRAMLLNERYLGKLVWNKTKWIKDRATGKRRQVDNPREEWVTVERPDLRIVDDATFAEAQARFRRRRPGPGRPAGITKRPSVCSGLLKCGVCGGSLTAISGKQGKYRQFGCTTHYTRGSSVCPNGMTVSETKASEALIAEVKRALTQPGVADDLAALFEREMSLATKTADEDRLAKQLAAAERKVRNLYDAVGKLGLTDALNTSIKQAEEDVAALKAQAAKARPRGRVLLHPTAVQVMIDDMLVTLQKDAASARQLLLKHAGTLVFTPTADGYKWEGGFSFGGTISTAPAEEVSPAGVVGNSSSGGPIRSLYNAISLEIEEPAKA